MEGIWKRAFGKGLLEEGKFLEGNWHAPYMRPNYLPTYLSLSQEVHYFYVLSRKVSRQSTIHTVMHYSAVQEPGYLDISR